jgi:DNA-nicking Smr family endonuclease
MAEAEGKRIEALQLKIKVRDLDYEAQKLHEKAARRYYAARNTVEISDKIDVHGLRPREAFDRIERTIIKASCEGKSIVRVIVGKGLHSVNRQPTLKPAVQREMQRLGLTCEVDPRNPGILNVSIPRSTS